MEPVVWFRADPDSTERLNEVPSSFFSYRIYLHTCYPHAAVVASLLVLILWENTVPKRSMNLNYIRIMGNSSFISELASTR